MKHISAIIAAILVTAIIGLGIFVVGVNALANTNTVPLQNSPNAVNRYWIGRQSVAEAPCITKGCDTGLNGR